MSVLNVFSILDRIFNAIMFSKCRCNHGKNVRINGRIHIHGRGGALTLGNNVTLTSSDDKNPSDGSVRTHLSIFPNAELSIGDGTGITSCAITASERVSIGENVLIGSGSMIADTDFHSVNIEDRLGAIRI